jgi:hypothetical protein
MVSGTSAREEGLRTLTSPRREASLFKLGRNSWFRPFSFFRPAHFRLSISTATPATTACGGGVCTGDPHSDPENRRSMAPSAYALIAPDPLAVAARGLIKWRRRQKSGQWLFDCAYDEISTVGGAHNTSAPWDNIEVPA